MKIINKTNWNTNDLKKIIIKALNEDDKVEGKFTRRNKLEITIKHSKGYPSWVVDSYKRNGKELAPRQRYSGCAYLNGNRMRLCVPREAFIVSQFVRLFTHEMSHIRGIRSHRLIGDVDSKDLEWTRNYSVGLEKTNVKPKVDLQIKRYEHVLAALEIKKTQLKRLQNQIKKWTQKKNYYENVLSANGKLKEDKKIDVWDKIYY